MRRIVSLFQGKKRAMAVLLVALLAGVGVFLVAGQKKSQPRYQTATVERGTIISSVSASGQVVTTGRMPILSQASGQVKEVYVKNGDTVLSGQKILSINLDPVASQKSASAWSSYLSSKTTLDAANVNLYSTQSTMFTKWKTYYDLATSSTYQNSDQTPNDASRTLAAFHIAQDDWLAAEASYKNQQTVVAQAQAAVNSSFQNYQLISADLVAPASGVIQDLTYVPGMLISSSISTSGITQSQMIASVFTKTSPTITVNLSEVDVNRVTEGDKATLTFDALPNKTFTGKVVGINKTGVVSSGVTNYPATILLDLSPTGVLPNMSVSASVIVDSKSDILVVPSEAVHVQGGGSSVSVLKSGQVQSVTVETGLSSDTQAEIVSGLTEGDVVVTGTVGQVTSGQSSPFNTFRIGGVGGGGGFRGGGGR